ncbi:hypothetical protein NMY22_g18641 [Coprinellus aureogranulatus]|nr:hypothetical protein NMY22_g18641 [Coprinellus aureogranulatus]
MMPRQYPRFVLVLRILYVLFTLVTTTLCAPLQPRSYPGPRISLSAQDQRQFPVGAVNGPRNFTIDSFKIALEFASNKKPFHLTGSQLTSAELLDFFGRLVEARSEEEQGRTEETNSRRPVVRLDEGTQYAVVSLEIEGEGSTGPRVYGLQIVGEFVGDIDVDGKRVWRVGLVPAEENCWRYGWAQSCDVHGDQIVVVSRVSLDL